MEKLLLNTQMFAEEEKITYDTEKLTEYSNTIKTVQKEINEMLNNFKTTCEELLEQNLSAEANAALKEAIEEIEKVVNNYSEQLTDLGTFFTQIIDAFMASESTVTNEINAWLETVKQAASAIYTSTTTQVVEKGGYSAGEYTTEMISIAASASEHTRALVGDAVKAVQATGKAINSLTGMTVVDAVKTGVKNTISTLTGWLSGNKSSATGLRLFSK